MGGQTGFGPVPVGDDGGPPFAADWEARVYALATMLRRRGVFNSDELRDAIERLPPERVPGGVVLRALARRDRNARRREGPGDGHSAVSYPAGSTVRVRTGDPDHHTRVPRYVRGHTGVIVAALDQWPVPDDSARGIDPPRVETCYAVRFSAADLWGSGDHTVTVDLWESYLDQP